MALQLQILSAVSRTVATSLSPSSARAHEARCPAEVEDCASNVSSVTVVAAPEVRQSGRALFLSYAARFQVVAAASRAYPAGLPLFGRHDADAAAAAAVQTPKTNPRSLPGL